MTQLKDAGARRAPLSQWAPVRLLCYAAGIMATVVAATIVTRLLVPPAPSPWHELVLIKNALLPLLMLALYAGLVHLMGASSCA